MTEILFYHLQRQPLEAVLPTLLSKSRARGWNVVVQATSTERVAALDDLLWTYDEQSFLPHGTDEEANAHEHPILLTISGANPNGAAIRFLIDGADLPPDADGYERLVLLFDGNDEDALAHAREAWKAARAAGHDATYWQQDDGGRWTKKA